MRWITIKILIVCLSLSSSLSADAKLDAGQLIEKMVFSSKNKTFYGDFVYQQGSQLNTLSIIHQVEEGRTNSEQELVVYLDGAPREIIRNADEVVLVRDGQVSHLESGLFVPVISKFTSRVSENIYDLRIAGTSRIAGREAVILNVVPKDRFRYGYQLWLDRQSSLLLKSVLFDHQRKIIELMQFTSLKIGQLPTDVQALLKRNTSLADENLNKTMHTRTERPDITDQHVEWETGWLPDGFELKSRSTRPSSVSQHPVASLTFSDGVATFSVFVEQDDTHTLSQASEKIGALSTVSKIYKEGNKSFSVTVVGDIPLGTAERLALSVRSVKKAS